MSKRSMAGRRIMPTIARQIALPDTYAARDLGKPMIRRVPNRQDWQFKTRAHSRAGHPAAEPRRPALTAKRRVCDTADMSETLTIRLAAEEKAQWEKAAAAARESVAEYVRGAVRQRAQSASQSPWEPHLGSANVAVPAPTNANIRRAFARDRSLRAKS